MLSGAILSLLAISFFFAMLACTEWGRRIGAAALTRNPDGLAKGTGSAEAAVFGLLGLLIAFTFSGAAERFEARRHLHTTEANSIGTAYLRLDVLPEDARSNLRELLRTYLKARMAAYENVEDIAATQKKMAEVTRLQGQIWADAVTAARSPDAPPQAMPLLLPALNDMIDITTTRIAATKNHPPLIIFLLLAALGLIGAIFVGYGISLNKNRTWLHTVAFAAIMALAFNVILELEFPRLGFIQVTRSDALLHDVLATMK